MNFDWNSNTIRWYQEANEYSGFYKKIAGLIAPSLEGYSSLCDIGCGLGLVDLELCKSIKKITCIDINREAIATLKKSVQDKKITNIEPCRMDCNDIDEIWDIIYVSFFGSRELEEFLPHCKKLIAVVSKKDQAELYPAKYRKFTKNTAEEVEQDLIRKGIPFSFKEASFEFGQPLRSREDAQKFIMSNSPEITPEDLARFLSQRLIKTGKTQYPFYISRKKSMRIFEIEGKQ